MKIIYLGNFNNKDSDKTEEHIKYAFEQLGHEVIAVPESNLVSGENDMAAEVLNIENPDLFLFHKGGVGSVITLDLLVKLLNYITCKKVFWYFDKVFPDREEYIENVTPYVDYGFLTDDTYLRRHNSKNLSCLRQGIGNEDTSFGKFRKEYECDIAFVGNPYGERAEFIKTLSQAYGDRFKVFNNVFNRDLYDLCASAKVIVAPTYPNDEFYWSSRIYMILGSGGFLIHPDLYGLKDEFEEGKHFIGYKTIEEMMVAINYFTDPKHEEERSKIQMAGYKQCHKIATYKDRIKQMLKICENSE